MKNECKYKQGIINATAQFPLPIKTRISLTTLHTQLLNTPWIKTSNGHPAYIQTSFQINQSKNSLKIFKNGKTTCCHTISPKAWTYFLDFFYYTYIINALEDSHE